jgi:hypothetical protein
VHRSLRAFITSSEWVDGVLVQERFTAALATFAAALTVLLACMGVYGCSRTRRGNGKSACAWAAARLVRAQLYGIAHGDPRTLLLGAAILLATVLAAALRASRVAPLEAFREE